MRRLRQIALVLLPLAALGALVWFLQARGPLGALRTAFPPVEELTIERVELHPGEMTVYVTNGGPSAVTVAQVTVDDAYWQFEMTPGPTIGRLGHARIHLNYPWVEHETHRVKLVSSTGLTFEREIAVAVPAPIVDIGYLVKFGMLGVYVGVLPVLLGISWFPWLRRLGRGALFFLLAFTVGLLVFLGIDALHEALDLSGQVPGAFQGTGLVAIGVVLSFLAVTAFSASQMKRAGTAEQQALTLGYLIAVGIGLHNLAEGLAIGAAYTQGELALGSFLVIGFTLHNTTEGIGIVAPLARAQPRVTQLLAMGAIAGAPTILGTWVGAFSFSPVWGTLLLAVGAGAIFQVVYEVMKLMQREPAGSLGVPANFAGLAAGLLVMYATGLLVAG